MDANWGLSVPAGRVGRSEWGWLSIDGRCRRIHGRLQILRIACLLLLARSRRRRFFLANGATDERGGCDAGGEKAMKEGHGYSPEGAEGRAGGLAGCF